jgi:hypothetical protein
MVLEDRFTATVEDSPRRRGYPIARRGVTMTTRCKVVVTEKKPLYRKGWDKPIDGEEAYAYMINLGPVPYGSSPENASFFEATPCIQINLGVVNASGAAVFKQGEEMYVDFTPAKKETQED